MNKKSLLRVAAALGTLGLAVMTQAQHAGSPKYQCSLAVVSSQIGDSARLCDRSEVERLASNGRVFEQNQLGIASMLVLSPDYSEKEAVRWFETAARRGYGAAQVNLAVMYLNGWGTPVNYGAALQWLHAAAEQRFARAYYDLGIMYLEAKGVKQDNDEAFRWFEKAAEAGDSSGETNLGYMYDQGLGCKRDLNAALRSYEKAAKAGNALGENNIADLYLRGEGVKQDDAAAFLWFQRAAAQGHTGAQIKLGYLYANGRGTAKEMRTAFTWLMTASEAGDPRGKELMHAVENHLDAGQIAEARKEAARMLRAEPQQSARNFAP